MNYYLVTWLELLTDRARSVQDLEHALLAVHLHLFPVAVLNGGVVLLHEDTLDKLDSQGGLAHAAATQHHNLVFSHSLLKYVTRQYKIFLHIRHENLANNHKFLALRDKTTEKFDYSRIENSWYWN